MGSLNFVVRWLTYFPLSLATIATITTTVNGQSTATNSSNLLPFVFQPLPLGSIKPSGWLYNEMQASADGLAGHLHEFYRFVSQSSWLGGMQEYSALNEGFPYWFNAIVPLAYGLDDDRLKAQVKSAFTSVLAHQSDDGWIGPETGDSRNFWARFPFFLGLINLVQADASYRANALDTFHKFNELMNSMLNDDYNGYLYHSGDTVSSFDTSWGRVRMCDMLVSLQWLLENDPRNASSSITNNMQLLIDGQLDWSSWYVDGVYPTQGISILPESETQADYWFQHGVNIGQGLKAGAVIRRFTKNDSLVSETERAVRWTYQYHGAPSGVLIADERLEGLTPYYGSELCTVVETMYSMSYLYQSLGTASYADHAELAMFNALPAMLTADHWAHQYVAEPNQPFAQNLTKGNPFYNVNSWGQTFGLEPDYPCCTVNHGQGLPKYLAAMFSGVGKNGTEGLAHTLLGPASVQMTLVDDNKVSLSCQTNYPFDSILTYSVSANSAFNLYIRVPEWAEVGNISFKQNGSSKSLALNMNSNTRMQQIRIPSGDSNIVYNLSAEVSVQHRANDTVTIRWGALLYALDIGSVNETTPPKLYNDPATTQTEGTYPKQARDYQIFNTTAWNVAIDPSTLRYQGGAASEDLQNPVFAPGAPPGRFIVQGCEIEWPMYLSVPAPAPLKNDRKCIGKVQEYTLRPYGSTKIRMNELPTMDFSGTG